MDAIMSLGKNLKAIGKSLEEAAQTATFNVLYKFPGFRKDFNDMMNHAIAGTLEAAHGGISAPSPDINNISPPAQKMRPQ
jgi:hypothetical protein